MSLLIEAFLALAAITLISIGTVVVISRMLVGRVRRSRTVNAAALRARARVTVGPQREVLKQRLRLSETLDSGQAAIDLAGRTDNLRGDLRRLFRRILEEGVLLETQLHLLESERDSVVLAEAIPAAIRRVDQVEGLVRRVRGAVAAGLGDRTDDNLTALYADADREIAALAAGVRELHRLNGYDRLGYDSQRADGERDSQRPLSMDHLTRGDRS